MGDLKTAVELFFSDFQSLLELISGSFAVIGVIGLAMMYLGSTWPLIGDFKGRP